jgi:hypothetical protein
MLISEKQENEVTYQSSNISLPYSTIERVSWRIILVMDNELNVDEPRFKIPAHRLYFDRLMALQSGLKHSPVVNSKLLKVSGEIKRKQRSV